MSNFSQNVKPTLSLGEALNSVFSNYANFSGRARRSEYWWFTGLIAIISLLFNFMQIAMLMQGDDSLYTLFQIVSVVFGLGTFLPMLSVTVRRFHDIGKSGWNWLWAALPLVGWIMFLVWMCQDSDVVANEYGESPKYN